MVKDPSAQALATRIGRPSHRRWLWQAQAAGSAHGAGLSEHRFHRGKWIYNRAGRVREGWPCVQGRTMQPAPQILVRRRPWREGSVMAAGGCASRSLFRRELQRTKMHMLRTGETFVMDALFQAISLLLDPGSITTRSQLYS